jgi:hypothetical protein
MLIMEHLYVVHAIECVLTSYMKLKLLRLRKYGLTYKSNCFLVPFLDNLVLDLALKLVEKSLSLTFGFHFPNYLEVVTINEGTKKRPPP